MTNINKIKPTNKMFIYKKIVFSYRIDRKIFFEIKKKNKKNQQFKNISHLA